jgi:hypothetical protein
MLYDNKCLPVPLEGVLEVDEVSFFWKATVKQDF